MKDTGLTEQLTRLVAAARRQGRLRSDATIQDIRILPGGCARALIGRDVRDSAGWRRYATLVLTALRP